MSQVQGMHDWWATRWEGTTRGQRWLGGVLVAAFVWGTMRHARDLLLGGADVYASAPNGAAAYWLALTFLDPTAAVLVSIRSRVGLVLAPAILVSDVLVNAYVGAMSGAFGWPAGVGLFVVATLAAVSLVAARWLWFSPGR